ncbi:MAG: AAA family ATPase [Candidatus Thermoplasmatota archaeon]
MSLVEEEWGGPTVFKDLGKIDFDYIPDELPGRETELKALAAIYKGLMLGANREHALVWGPVGVGKTALAERFARDLSAALQRQGKRLEHVRVNCRKLKSAGLAMLAILNKFDANYPERGFAVGEMLRDLRRHLERRQAHLVVILDEVDALLRSDGSNLVYDLTRLNDEAGPTWCGVSLLMVSQENVLPLLDAAALSTFKQTNVVAVGGYGAPQLVPIVQQRVALAFRPGAVDGDTVYLIADAAAAQNGNARFAIEVLGKAGHLADGAGAERVDGEHVRSAQGDTHAYITTAKLQSLPRHVLLALLGLARRLKRGDAYTTTGAAEEAYRLACEEFGEAPRAHTQYWKYVNQLKEGGFIVGRLSGKGTAGTTQFLSIPDAPAAQVEARVVQLLNAPSANS